MTLVSKTAKIRRFKRDDGCEQLDCKIVLCRRIPEQEIVEGCSPWSIVHWTDITRTYVEDASGHCESELRYRDEVLHVVEGLSTEFIDNWCKERAPPVVSLDAR